MYKIYLHMVLVVSIAIGIIYSTAKHIILAPYHAFQKSIQAFREVLCTIPHKIRKHLPYFDANGLRYSIEHLQSIRIEKMITWTAEEQAEYADTMAVQFCKESSIHELFEVETDEIHYKDILPTSIGNAAYIFINHPSIDERRKAMRVLNTMQKIIDTANN